MSLAPNSSHLRFSVLFFWNTSVQELSPEGFRALAFLYSRVGTGQVWTYLPPDDGLLVNDDKWLAFHARTTPTKWKRIKKEVLQFFSVEGNFLRFKYPEWVEIAYGMSRPSIPAGTRSFVMQRDNFRCVYCGTVEGPFDLDHVVPIAKGGDPTSQDNLVCACAPCNRSKRAMTPEDWLR